MSDAAAGDEAREDMLGMEDMDDELDAAEMAEAHAALLELQLTPDASPTHPQHQPHDRGHERDASASPYKPAARSTNGAESTDAEGGIAGVSASDSTRAASSAHTTHTPHSNGAACAAASSSAAAAATTRIAAADDGVDAGDPGASEVTASGPLWKQSRRHGDERPWKRRYFVLRGGSLLYHHTASHSDPTQLLCHIPAHAAVAECDAPRGYGLAIAAPPAPEMRLATDGQSERAEWLAALRKAAGAPRSLSADDAEAEQLAAAVASSGLFKLKAALASAFATSRLGRHLIKRYLDDAGRTLIRTVVAFVAVESGARTGARFETYVFDVASRIAVIMHAQAVPNTVNFSLLQDDTVSLCQEYIRFARDRRMREARRRYANAEPAVLELDLFLAAGERVATAWRAILAHSVPAKVVRRFDAVVAELLSERAVRALLDDERHRERMATVEHSLRELLETY